MGSEAQIEELVQSLDSDVLDERLTTIQVLGEIGDEAALEALRGRLRVVSRELSALVIAVGKLKRKLGAR